MAELIVREQALPSEVAGVLAIADATEAHDGVRPLSEHALLGLRHGGGRSLLLWEDAVLAGYAHLDSGSAELVVHPAHRRRGHGRTLLKALLGETQGPLRVWAHGELPAAVALAAGTGFSRVRALFQLRRPTAEPLPAVSVPAGVRIAAFEAGRDEGAWLKVNSRAFAHHPEQGLWTLDDLLQREAEPWFDPAGFFLAWRGDQLIGFHWTKVHPDGLGEVYVVGVDPDGQGMGLGRALTLAGLEHLAARGASAVLLYVDESNVAAVGLYEDLGFTRWTTDAMYEHT
jgi:mycothiol synthase